MGSASDSRLALEYRRGLHLVGTVLWFDSVRARDLSFVSHAHVDHLAPHRKILATPATARLVRHRIGETAALVSPFGRVFSIGGMTIELFSAGHVLGSAQIRVSLGGEQLVYTGDLNVAPNRTCEPHETRKCDVLVIESTFGHPRYKFPAREEVEAAVARFATDTLARGETPAFLAYSLGKAQEVARILGDAGIPTRAHRAAYEIVEIYREMGVDIPLCKALAGRAARGEAVIIPPGGRRGGRTIDTATHGVKVAAVTGWAVDASTRYRMKVDEAIPLSDHADFDGLMSYVRAVAPKRVFVMHGFCEDFSRALRAEGFDAAPLIPPKQLEMFA
ncbi:MAG: MBL fold metallo-hydrolase [Deltaproteobacteria bacterium]|nr:MBL fold metallo-hydrolase [Deltaproteobacteria bacterium]